MSDTTWSLKRTVQCQKCPWRKGVDPHEIPNGYAEEKHKALKSTIARPADLSQLGQPELRVMACHETNDAHCIGWLMNQLGPGNNLLLRLRMRSCSNTLDLKLLGKQHGAFEETLPKKKP